MPLQKLSPMQRPSVAEAQVKPNVVGFMGDGINDVRHARQIGCITWPKNLLTSFAAKISPGSERVLKKVGARTATPSRPSAQRQLKFFGNVFPVMVASICPVFAYILTSFWDLRVYPHRGGKFPWIRSRRTPPLLGCRSITGFML